MENMKTPRHSIANVLATHFGLTERELQPIQELLDQAAHQPDLQAALSEKILEISAFFKVQGADNIDKQAYLIKSLQYQFCRN
ncbi:hypothetical protein V9K67_24495 [Paraflavisolibacter sp. H34]|uniref:hypothetical protein n=1 Tax=Huijunlia imazamoxiresistens TaxID=3127457 RepID=UPI00301B3452